VVAHDHRVFVAQVGTQLFALTFSCGGIVIFVVTDLPADFVGLLAER